MGTKQGDQTERTYAGNQKGGKKDGEINGRTNGVVQRGETDKHTKLNRATKNNVTKRG